MSRKGLTVLVTWLEKLGVGYFESSFCWYQPAARAAHPRGAARPLNPKGVHEMAAEAELLPTGLEISLGMHSSVVIHIKCSCFKRAVHFFLWTSKAIKPMSVIGGILNKSKPVTNQTGFQFRVAASPFSGTWCFLMLPPALCNNHLGLYPPTEHPPEGSAGTEVCPASMATQRAHLEKPWNASSSISLLYLQHQPSHWAHKVAAEELVCCELRTQGPKLENPDRIWKQLSKRDLGVYQLLWVLHLVKPASFAHLRVQIRAIPVH